MKNQTLSIEQMKHLKALGVDVSKASMVCLFIDEDCNEIDWDSVENHGKDKPLYEWYDDENDHWVEATPEYFAAESGTYDHSNRESCGVFTLQDILELLPKIINKPGKNQCAFFRILYRSNGEVSVKYSYGFDDEFEGVFFKGLDLLNCVYQMLCWLAENGYLKGGKP